jgi:hypothetical protein
MKLFGKKQWILSISSFIIGLIFTGYILKVKFGEVNIWIVGLTGLIGLLIIIFVGRYANK